MMIISLIPLVLLGASTAHLYGRRILGGHEIKIEDAPYQVAVFYNHSIYCGGSLISQSFVLTAAHCLDAFPYDNGEFAVKIGTNHSDWDHPSGLKLNVEKIFKHPEYNKSNYLEYDFALFKLEEYDELPEIVEFANLPTVDDHLADNDAVYITGWGKTENGMISKTLRRAVVPIVHKEKCEKPYLPDGIKITDRMICAGYDEGGVDSCNYDSGGPLVRISDGVQFGVTSFGNECGNAKYPGVYANISSVLDWIESITNTY